MLVWKNSVAAWLKSVIVTALIFAIKTASAQTVAIYVSPNGANTGNGLDPLKPISLNRATTAINSFPNDSCTVWLDDGFYGTLSLNATNTRRATAPVTFRATHPLQAIFQPLTNIDTLNFQPLPLAIQNRIIDSVAKTKVKQLPLGSYSLKNMSVWPNVFGIANLTSPKFYNNGAVLPMSRYPKDSNMTMKKVLNNGVGGQTPGGTFAYRNNRCKYWLKALADDGVFLSGAWRVPWQIDVVKTLAIDTIADTIRQTIGVSGGIGDKYSRPAGNGKEPYWAIDLVEEISMPGEWSINFKNQMLYMWVPDNAKIQVASDATVPAINLSGVGNIAFQGIAIIGGAGDGFALNNCSNVTIAGCEIRNVSGNAVTILGGSNCTVQSNDLHHLGGAGIKVSSANFLADQKNVTLCNHQIVNNHIYSVALEKQVYYPPIDISAAIGAFVGHNLLKDAPQIGIYWGGNSNIIEYNEAADIGNKYGGASAYYRTGNFADRGNKVRYNFVHDSPLGGGISEDNNGTGDSIYYNIIANTFLGSNNNGGYADIFTNNIYVGNVPAHSSAITKDTSSAYLKMYKNLQTLYNGSAAYRAAYPDAYAMLDTVNGANKAFGSMFWNQFNCNVLYNNSVAFSGIKDTVFFNKNGTQKASATTATGAAFKTYGTMVKDNLKMGTQLAQTIAPFKIDSLKAVAAFAKPCGKDWHIHRIGLHKDAYRTHLDSTATAGAAPRLVWRSQIVHGDSLLLEAIAVNPNIANCFSEVRFYVDSVAVPTNHLTIRPIAYDTVAYTIAIGGIAPGNHTVYYTLFDAPYWLYSSSPFAFTVSIPLPVSSLVFKGTWKNDRAFLEWTAQSPSEIAYFELMKSTDAIHYSPVQKIHTKTDAVLGNTYQSYQPQPEATAYYRLATINRDGTSLSSETVEIKKYRESSMMAIYPNPVGQRLYWDVGTATKIIGLTVYDAKGKAVKKVLPRTNSTGCPSIDVSSLGSGTYFLQATTHEGEVMTMRFVKEL